MTSEDQGVGMDGDAQALDPQALDTRTIERTWNLHGVRVVGRYDGWGSQAVYGLAAAEAPHASAPERRFVLKLQPAEPMGPSYAANHSCARLPAAPDPRTIPRQ